MSIRVCFLILCVLFVTNASAEQNISIETQSSNLFENIVSDTLLLLDRSLQEKLSPDFDYIVKNSTFTIKKNSWIPKTNPKITLLHEYHNMNVDNLHTSFASIIQPVIELACFPRGQDPFNELSSKCIRALFVYPIIQPIRINYNYDNTTDIEQTIGDLPGGVDDSDKYKKIVRVMADIMNSAFARSSNSDIKVSLNVVKYPLELVQSYSPGKKAHSVNNSTAKSAKLDSAAAEKATLEKKLLKLENTSSGSLNISLREKEKMVENTKAQMEELEKDPANYVQKKKAEREAYEERMRKADLREERKAWREGRSPSYRPHSDEEEYRKVYDIIQ